MGSIRLELLEQFGTGKEAREQRKEFLKTHGGIKGLRELRTKEGSSGLNQKISSFKSNNKGRPGQKENKPDSPKDPQIKDDTKPNPDKEWGKKDEDKLSKLKEDSKEFKKFEAKNKEDAIKEINEAFDKKDLAKLRGIVDKSLNGQKLSPQEKLTAFGLADKEGLVLSGKADKEGVFGLYRVKDTKNPFAKITIDEKGEFKYETINDKSKEKESLQSKNLKTLEDVRNNSEVYKKFEPKSKAEALNAMEKVVFSGRVLDWNNNLKKLNGQLVVSFFDKPMNNATLGQNISSLKMVNNYPMSKLEILLVLVKLEILK